jgi:hypothetical protein
MPFHIIRQALVLWIYVESGGVLQFILPTFSSILRTHDDDLTIGQSVTLFVQMA